MSRYILLFICSFPLLFIHCVKDQSKVSWLHIERWELEAHPFATQSAGELSHNFNQVFLSMGGRFIGTFELPIKIPILAEGMQSFVLVPGCVINGINATKMRYPFVENYQIDFELKLQDTVFMQPVTRYFPNTKFLIEDFESPLMNLKENQGDGYAKLIRSNDPTILKWGNFFGRVEINAVDSFFVANTTFGANLPGQNADVFLELDIMNTNSMGTSVISYNSVTGDFDDDINIQVNPQSDPRWRKMYISLREIISFRQQANVNEQGLFALFDNRGEDTYIYLDNLKVVYR